MRITRLFTEFVGSEKAGGLILILCTAVSLIIANSSWQVSYMSLWNYPVAGHTLVHWINDGLMTIFFLLIGLELEREVYVGELSDPKNAVLPVAGALGGMIVPASIYLFFNYGTATQSGAGIPMATDIAFALGILSLLGSRVPPALKVFLTALAVIDDLGAILVIAVFYTQTLSWLYLGIAIGVWLLLLLLNRLKVYHLLPYLLGGIVMWYCMLHSGVHATITGILLAFAIPFEKGDEGSVSYRLQHHLHIPVAFIILPLFALANTAIVISGNPVTLLQSAYGMGILTGLVAGKVLGISLFCFLAVVAGACKLPEGTSWKSIIATAMLGGIGFTMSIFICLLAFTDNEIINNAKFIILAASLLAGIIGFALLRVFLPHYIAKQPQD